MTRPRRLPKVLTPDEQRAFLAKFDRCYPSALRNLVAVRLMLQCGLRRGKDRIVWFSDDLRDLISRWLDRRPASDWLLCTRHAAQVNSRYLRELVKRKAVSAGIPEADRVTPHVLRHTFATDLLRETKNIRLAQKALGHASLATTMIYTHVADEELETAMRRERPSGRGTGVGQGIAEQRLVHEASRPQTGPNAEA